MDAVNLLVASGALVSSAFFVSRLDRPVVLQVPSMAANGVQLQWTTVSGTAPFAPLHDPQAGAMAATVFSGTGGGYARVFAPAQYGRVSFVTTMSAPMSLQLYSGV